MKWNKKSKMFRRGIIGIGMAGVFTILATQWEQDYTITGIGNTQNALELEDIVNLNTRSDLEEKKYFVPELSLLCCEENGLRKGIVAKQVDATTWQSIVSPSLYVHYDLKNGFQVRNSEKEEELSSIVVKEVNQKIYPYVQQFCNF